MYKLLEKNNHSAGKKYLNWMYYSSERKRKPVNTRFGQDMKAV